MKILTAIILCAAASTALAQTPCVPGFSPPCPDDPPAPLATETQYSSALRCHYPAFDLHLEIRAARPFDLTDPDRDAQCLRIREAVEMEVVP